MFHSSMLPNATIWASTVRKEIRRFRILIVGRANAGKTTILQRVCNTTALPEIIAPTGDRIDLSTISPSAQRGEHDIENEMVFKSNPGFVFHDSRGFEAGGSSEFQTVKQFIANRAEQKLLSDRLHAIWYCIPTNDATRPITRAELDFFEECGTGNVPVIVLFTKTDSMDSRMTKQLIKAGYTDEEAEQRAPIQGVIDFQERFCGILYQKKHPPTSHLFFREMQHPEADVGGLIKSTAEALASDKNLLQLFVSTQQTSLNLCIEYAIKRDLLDKLNTLSALQERLLSTTEKNNVRLVLPILQWFPHLVRPLLFLFSHTNTSLIGLYLYGKLGFRDLSDGADIRLLLLRLLQLCM
ncbi:uncharacterized protein LACBIDRAFT_313263 [Laccaria bicolor S238N-H82]|uniref:Predicted protein n=1 Tax=Laccaria bicolor (strain S238N-H82 / ATCC MYA-4686) TaxID=486041 RepID=B0DXX6_LACBS|nr:uncharacterized protein LACBIDRAFT_313263 [Laccaria bicolor S238N-H82]EDR00539.1 predicted protein [Laccaria bicolor S238N-H82]|eukprot:XP_001888766.1 predicted protein [Laccaria bicolor S238N-H82]